VVVDKCIRDFFAGGSEDARDGGTVNLHLPGSGILFKTHSIAEAERLKLIKRDPGHNDIFTGDMNGAKTPIPGLTADLPYFLGPHGRSLIMHICA